jgi:hypothetical protein
VNRKNTLLSASYEGLEDDFLVVNAVDDRGLGQERHHLHPPPAAEANGKKLSNNPYSVEKSADKPFLIHTP